MGGNEGRGCVPTESVIVGSFARNSGLFWRRTQEGVQGDRMKVFRLRWREAHAALLQQRLAGSRGAETW